MQIQARGINDKSYFFQVEASHIPLGKFQGGGGGEATTLRQGISLTIDRSTSHEKIHTLYGIESTSKIPNFVSVGNCEEKYSTLNTLFWQRNQFGL